MDQLFLTGASSDIGMAICRRYLAEGHKVVAHYHAGRDIFNDLVNGNKNLIGLNIDFSDPENVEAAIQEHKDILCASDIFINAAAIFEATPFSQITAEKLTRALNINLVPGYLFMRTIAPAMCERGWGRIVQLSSISAQFGGGSASFCYALSKYAMEFLPSDHKKWAKHDVLANVLRVGVTDTRIHQNDPTKSISKRVALIPIGRMASVDEIAEVAFWLGSKNNTFVTGQTIIASGGE